VFFNAENAENAERERERERETGKMGKELNLFDE
jgi:hypothetical protein